MNKERKIVSF